MRTALRIAGDPDTAEDVAQEVVVALLRRPDAALSSRRSWVVGAARHLSWRELSRRRRGTGRADSPISRPAGELAPHAAIDEFQLATALRRLREPYRSTIIKRFIHELAPSRIAEQEGCSVETVYSRLKRGLQILRAQLDGARPGEARSRAHQDRSARP